MKKKILLLFCLCYPVLIFSQVNVVVLVPEYPPLASAVIPSTLWCELVQTALAQENVAVTYKSYPLERMKARVKNGEDVAFINSILVINQNEISQSLSGVYPFINLSVGAFYLKSQFPQGIGPLESPRKKTLSAGVLLGTGAVAYLTKLGLTPDISHSLQALFQKLHMGRNDFVVVGDLTGWEILRSTWTKKELEDVKFMPLYNSPIGFIISKTHPKGPMLQQKFIDGLKKIKKDGTYLKIIKRFYPSDWLNLNIIP